jgi:NADPH:quinone reductase
MLDVRLPLEGRATMSGMFRFHRYGGPQELIYEDLEIGAPGRGQVRIRNTAVAVNFRDVMLRRGSHEVPSFPSGIGIESVGRIDAVGPDVHGLAIGDRVTCIAGPDNAYAEQRIIPAARAVIVPPTIDDATAAAMMIRGMMARSLLKETYRVRSGDPILIHAAAGGVGLIMCQWAKHLGATVIGTVGSREKAYVAREYGCDHTILYGHENFADRVLDITGGEGVPVVYDSVGWDTFEGSLRCLGRRGVLASFGESSGEPEPLAPRVLGEHGSVFLTYPRLGDYTATRAKLLECANDLFMMVATGKVRVVISRTHGLEDAARAHADLESRATTGSTVLMV